jgi:hypothetical protein
MPYYPPNAERCEKLLNEKIAEVKAQREALALVLPLLKTFKRAKLDGWLLRHLRQGLPVDGVRVSIAENSGIDPRLVIYPAGVRFDARLTVWPVNGPEYGMYNDVACLIMGADKLTDSLENYAGKLEALSYDLPEVLASYNTAARELDRLSDIPGMSVLSEQLPTNLK